MFRLQQAAVDIHNPYYPKTPNVQIKKPLRIDRIELCNSENGTRHHTDKFYGMNSKDDPQLIIRRGEVFYLRLLVDRDYWPQLDVVSFVFTLAGLYNFFVICRYQINVVITMTIIRNHLQYVWTWIKAIVETFNLLFTQLYKQGAYCLRMFV